MTWYFTLCLLFGAAAAGLHPWEDPEGDSWNRTETRSVSRSTTTCNCGWVNRGRIVGGKETKKNEFPLIVALEDRKHNQFCGGTIITPWHVLTAAHCTDGEQPRDMVIHAGAHDLYSSPGKRYAVSKIFVHEYYHPKQIINDISIVVTASQIQFNQNVGPACLPTTRMNLVGQRIKALGWGLIQHRGDASPYLQEVDLRVKSFRDCYKSWSNEELSPRESTNICTYEDNKDTCQGDSGGPLVWLDPSTNRYTIVALVSYGGICASELPAVNTDVASFLPWINQKISISKPGAKTCTKA